MATVLRLTRHLRCFASFLRQISFIQHLVRNNNRLCAGYYHIASINLSGGLLAPDIMLESKVQCQAGAT